MSDKFTNGMNQFQIEEQFIHFSDFPMDAMKATMIAEELGRSSTITVLNFNNNQFGTLKQDSSLEILTSAITKHEHLKELTMDENHNFGDGGSILIAEIIAGNESLTSLSLMDNMIGDNGAIAIADCLKESSTLKELSLENNSIGDDGIIAIGDALKGHRSLKWMDLKGNEFGNKGIVGLVAGLQDNEVLERLFLTLDADDGPTMEKLNSVWDEKTKQVKHEWSVERHGSYPLKFRDAVMEVLLMWNHDQYEEGECEGIRWNELPLEVVMNVIKWLGLYERVLDVWKRDRMNREWKNERNVKHSSGRKR